MHKTAIIIVSRERYSLLASCLESVLDNSSGNIKVYVGCDSDDPQTIEVAKKYKATAAVIEPQPVFDRASFDKIIYQHDTCDYIFYINDDITIQTKDFDIIIQETIEEFLKDKPDRIVYGCCQEIWPGYSQEAPGLKLAMEKELELKYACYPVLTRETVDCLGFFMPPGLACGADIELGRIFNTLKCSNIVPCQPRRLDIPIEIYDHIGHPGDSAKRDRPFDHSRHAQWLANAWHGGHAMDALINLSKHIQGALTPERQVTDSDYSYIFDQLPLPMRLPQEPEKGLPPGTPISSPL